MHLPFRHCGDRVKVKHVIQTHFAAHLPAIAQARATTEVLIAIVPYLICGLDADTLPTIGISLNPYF